MSNNMAKIADARKTVEQLKLEVNIDRMMVRHLCYQPTTLKKKFEKPKLLLVILFLTS